ncbi:hypothetical protein M0804_003826 [Polistes exclamans]|nr:hypothetical protein M0804_003826 [Polistes exclamans]
MERIFTSKDLDSSCDRPGGGIRYLKRKSIILVTQQNPCIQDVTRCSEKAEEQGAIPSKQYKYACMHACKQKYKALIVLTFLRVGLNEVKAFCLKAHSFKLDKASVKGKGIVGFRYLERYPFDVLLKALDTNSLKLLSPLSAKVCSAVESCDLN